MTCPQTLPFRYLVKNWISGRITKTDFLSCTDRNCASTYDYNNSVFQRCQECFYTFLRIRCREYNLTYLLDTAYFYMIYCNFRGLLTFYNTKVFLFLSRRLF